MNYFNLNVNYFYNEIEDLIRVDYSTGILFKNMSKCSTIQGVETELTFNFGKNRYGYVNTSYQNSEDTDGHKLPFVSDWMANAGYNHQFLKFFNTNINVSWIGERSRSISDPRDKNPASSTLVDLTLIAKNFYNGLEIKGSIFNVFDEHFVVPSTIVDTKVNKAAVPNDLPLHRRMFMIEAMLKF